MARRLLTALAVCFTLMPTLAAAQQQEVIEYYATDAIGSIRVVFDPAGAITSRRDYDPFGGEVTPVTSNPKVYAGLFRDDESKLDYAQARMYSARTGRFGSVDPVYAGLFDPQKWNRYAYAWNNPISFVDPEGLNASRTDPEGICGNQDASREFGSFCRDWDLLFSFYFTFNFQSRPSGGGFLPGTGEPAGGLGRQTPVPPPPPPPIFTPDPPQIPPGAPTPEATEDCQAVPSAPQGVSVDANIALAHSVRNDANLSAFGKLKWFYNQVRNKGPWDYKQQGRQYEAFGNFNFGATGSAVGISPNVLQRGAGAAQWLSGNRGQGSPLGTTPPFGDDSPDNINIRRGIAYYQQRHQGRPCK